MGAARGGSPGAASRRRPSRAGPRRLPPGRGLASVAGRARSGAGLAAPRSPAARTMVLFFLSRTTHLARYSSSLLGRQLCSASANMPVLTLFTKKPCPLCDEAKEALEPYKRRFILQEVDITLPENSAWYDKYKYDIPVFHLNGKFLMKHRVDIQKFEDQLSKLELHNHRNH
ncbi:glutaredoxin-like protein C5orf63 homolog isoform X3 [Oxyura jamaicensis]|uniref:glutaredoxin-like protein C5orf63 homolog isoform X3 n=1 Tax=Oxyura jamaicensis TaxID=8884 RepID=UPI0015A54BBE|nr:glutaredoxin-like protein C5orf63 homolog isoform X3 [Oxyura jamaicensis]